MKPPAAHPRPEVEGGPSATLPVSGTACMDPKICVLAPEKHGPTAETRMRPRGDFSRDMYAWKLPLAF